MVKILLVRLGHRTRTPQPFLTACMSCFSAFFSSFVSSLSFCADARSAASEPFMLSPAPPANTTSCNKTSCSIGLPNSRRNAGNPRLLLRKYCDVWVQHKKVFCYIYTNMLHILTYRQSRWPPAIATIACSCYCSANNLQYSMCVIWCVTTVSTE